MWDTTVVLLQVVHTYVRTYTCINNNGLSIMTGRDWHAESKCLERRVHLEHLCLTMYCMHTEMTPTGEKLWPVLVPNAKTYREPFTITATQPCHSDDNTSSKSV